MTFLAYSEADTRHGKPMPVGMGETQGAAAADAAARLTLIQGVTVGNETLVFREVDLSDAEKETIRKAFVDLTGF